MAKQKDRGMSSIKDTNLKYVTNQTWFNKKRIIALEEGGGGGGGAFESVTVGGKTGIKVTGAANRTQIGEHTIDGQISDIDPAVGPQNKHDVIMAGYGNAINYYAGSEGNFIGSGVGNTIEAFYGYLGGPVPSSFVGTGLGNTIEAEAYGSFIGTGTYNTIHAGRVSTVISGDSNYVYGDYGFIGTGYLNVVDNSNGSVILTGYGNTVYESGTSFIGLGYGNSILNNSSYSFIGTASNTVVDTFRNGFVGAGVDVSVTGGTTANYNAFIGVGRKTNIHDSHTAFIGIGDHGFGTSWISDSGDVFAGILNEGNIYDAFYTHVGTGKVLDVISTRYLSIGSAYTGYANLVNYGAVGAGYSFTMQYTNHAFMGTAKYSRIRGTYDTRVEHNAIIVGYNTNIDNASNSLVSGPYNYITGVEGVPTSGVIFGNNSGISTEQYSPGAQPESIHGFIHGEGNSIYCYGYAYPNSLNFGFIHGDSNLISNNQSDTNDHVALFGFDNIVEDGSYTFIAGHSNRSTGRANVSILGNNITASKDNCTFVNNLNIKDIPTSTVGLNSGDVWSNAGVLTVIP